MDKKELLDESLKTQVDSLLENIADDSESEKNDRNKEEEIVKLLDDNRLLVGTQEYELSIDHREGFDPEALAGRYTSILSKYDYIVGDWGYDQLRLKGFYRNNNSKVPKTRKSVSWRIISTNIAILAVPISLSKKRALTKRKSQKRSATVNVKTVKQTEKNCRPMQLSKQLPSRTPAPAPVQPNKNKVTKNVERPKSQGKKKGFVIKDVNTKDSQPKDQPKTTTTRSAKGEKKSFQIKKIEQ